VNWWKDQLANLCVLYSLSKPNFAPIPGRGGVVGLHVLVSPRSGLGGYSFRAFGSKLLPEQTIGISRETCVYWAKRQVLYITANAIHTTGWMYRQWRPRLLSQDSPERTYSPIILTSTRRPSNSRVNHPADPQDPLPRARDFGELGEAVEPAVAHVPPNPNLHLGLLPNGFALTCGRSATVRFKALLDRMGFSSSTQRISDASRYQLCGSAIPASATSCWLRSQSRCAASSSVAAFDGLAGSQRAQ
jgi:hypothetical protein